MQIDEVTIDKIVEDIVKDIEGRSGLGNEWEEIDSGIRGEIKEKWADIINRNIMLVDEDKESPPECPQNENIRTNDPNPEST